jgi:hypothetical protein
MKALLLILLLAGCCSIATVDLQRQIEVQKEQAK